MGHAQNHPSPHQQPRWQLWVFVITIIVTLPLGTIGFLQYEHEAIHPGTPMEWGHIGCREVLAGLYTTAQLFLLHTPHFAGTIPWALEIARWAAAVGLAVAALTSLAHVFGLEFRRLKVPFFRGHVVVCGSGWRGLSSVGEFPLNSAALNGATRKREDIVVVEQDLNAPGLAICHERGIPHVIGDPTSLATLKRAGVQHARMLVAACAVDEENLAIAIRARELSEASRTRPDGLRCFVQISDPDLRSDIRCRARIAAKSDAFRATTIGIDVYESSARWLFQHCQLDRVSITPESPLAVHLIVIGFGEMGESVVLQAARVGHFANGKPIRITVIDEDATALGKAFRDRYPQFKEVCPLEFLDLDPRGHALVKRASGFCCEANTLVTFVACLSGSARNLDIGLKFADELQKCRSPIWVHIDSRGGFTLLLTEEKQARHVADQIIPFGMIEDVANIENLERPELENLAAAFHQDYVAKRRETPDFNPADPALANWEELSEPLRNSNRHAADHLEFKLRAIGCHLARKDDPKARRHVLAPDEIEALARMEHARFCAERFLDGWRLAAAKNLELKTSPTLVPWADLPEIERHKDREQVNAIPLVVEATGQIICR